MQGILLRNGRVVVYNWVIRNEDGLDDLIDELNSYPVRCAIEGRSEHTPGEWISYYTSTKVVEEYFKYSLHVEYDKRDLDGKTYTHLPLDLYRRPKSYCILLWGFALDRNDACKQVEVLLGEHPDITEPIYTVVKNHSDIHHQVKFALDDEDRHSGEEWAKVVRIARNSLERQEEETQ